MHGEQYCCLCSYSVKQGDRQQTTKESVLNIMCQLMVSAMKKTQSGVESDGRTIRESL